MAAKETQVDVAQIEGQFAALTKRVVALEKAAVSNTETISWMAGTLGTMKAVQDVHTKRMDGIDSKLDEMDEHIDRLEGDIAGLRADMPGIVATAMREVMGKR